ncbi:MAG: alpha/beta hydrolase [Hungatella sp.]
MRKKQVSVRGNLIRDMLKDVMETSLKEPIQTGEFRKNPVEPAWSCPPGYSYEIIDTEHFKMEYLRPSQVVTGRVILQLHGGGYIGPMKNIYRKFAVAYSKRSMGGDVLTIDYRVAPKDPYPAALEDAVYAYRWLLEEKQYRADQIIIVGDSAGGGLALALGLYLRDHQISLPAGLIAMSPWADLTGSGESYETNYDRDPLFGESRDSMLFNSSYIGDHDPKDPYLSPIFGNFRDFSPMLIQVGSYEMLLSDSQTVARLAQKEQVKVRLSVYEGMFHVFQMSLNLFPESREAWDEVSRFLQILYHIERKTEGTSVKRVRGHHRSKSLWNRIRP